MTVYFWQCQCGHRHEQDNQPVSVPAKCPKCGECPVSIRTVRSTAQLSEENDLLRATVQELREALPKCFCGRVTTAMNKYENYGRCDTHAGEEADVPAPWAAIVRRLGW